MPCYETFLVKINEVKKACKNGCAGCAQQGIVPLLSNIFVGKPWAERSQKKPEFQKSGPLQTDFASVIFQISGVRSCTKAQNSLALAGMNIPITAYQLVQSDLEMVAPSIFAKIVFFFGVGFVLHSLMGHPNWSLRQSSATTYHRLEC